MSKKTFMATIIITAFLISLVPGILVVKVAKANPLPPSWMNPKMTITIQSPLPPSPLILQQPMRSYSLPILVNFTAQCSWGFALVNTPPASPSQDWIRAFYYVVDGQNMSSSGINFTEVQTTINPNDTNNYFDYSGQAYLTNLAAGSHNLTVYWGVLVNVGTPAQFIVYNPTWSVTTQFNVNTGITPTQTPTLSPSPTPTVSPTPSAAMNASLSESASALNFGNTINFTVSVEGGNAPFTYSWYIDGKLVENSTTPYYATDSHAVGSHHVYVEVNDADNNTAKTLSPEFNVLPSLTYMPSSPVSPTQQPTIEPNQTPDRPKIGDFAPVLIPASMILLGIIAVILLVYFRRKDDGTG